MTDLSREDVERLARIEAKLDNAIARLTEDRHDHDRDIRQIRADHEKDVDEIRQDMGQLTTRTGSLENWRYAIVAALLMSAGGTIAAAVNVAPK